MPPEQIEIKHYFPKQKGELTMTAMFVFVALIVANIAYQIYDGRMAEADRLMEDYFRVEHKKSYNVVNESRAMNGLY